MESGAGRRVHVVGKFLQQHRRPRRIDVATRDVSRARSTKRKSDYRSDGPASRTGQYGSDRSAIRHVRRRPGGGGRSVPLGFPVRRLQALRRRGLSGGVSGRIDRRTEPLPDAGGAFKCTFCYDRQKSGLVPACAKVCPTESIVFGRLDDLRARGAERVQQLQQSGYNDAQLYDPTETSVRGIHAFFLILGEPEAYGLPPKPQIPTIYLKSAWTSAFATAIASIIATLLAFAFFS